VYGDVGRSLARQPAEEGVETHSLMDWGHDPRKKG
jgi:hypothetical protein